MNRRDLLASLPFLGAAVAAKAKAPAVEASPKLAAGIPVTEMPIDEAALARIVPGQTTVVHQVWYGPRDPVAQRQIAEMVRRANRRNLP